MVVFQIPIVDFHQWIKRLKKICQSWESKKCSMFLMVGLGRILFLLSWSRTHPDPWHLFLEFFPFVVGIRRDIVSILLPGQFSSFQSLSCARLFVTPWTAACQASLSITRSWSLLKFMSIESMLPSNHLIFCHPLLLLPSIFTSIRVYSSESVLCIRWPKYWSFSFSTSLPVQDWFPLGLTGLTSLQSKELSRVFFNTIVQKHQFFSAQLFLWSNSHIHTWLLENPSHMDLCW